MFISINDKYINKIHCVYFFFFHSCLFVVMFLNFMPYEP